MNRNFFYLLLVGSLLLNACTEPAPTVPLRIIGFELSSTQPEQLANWYVANLGFTPTEANSLSLSNKSASLSFTQSAGATKDLAITKRYPGLFKIGFKTNELDRLYEKLQQNGNSFRGDIFYDNNLQTRSLVALDADGNRVQFFEDDSVRELTPYFFSIMALNFQETKAWCESVLGFQEAYNLDLPDRGLSIRLMEKDGVLLELIGDQRLSDDGNQLRGIESVNFNRSEHKAGEGKLVYSGSL